MAPSTARSFSAAGEQQLRGWSAAPRRRLVCLCSSASAAGKVQPGEPGGSRRRSSSAVQRAALAQQRIATRENQSSSSGDEDSSSGAARRQRPWSFSKRGVVQKAPTPAPERPVQQLLPASTLLEAQRHLIKHIFESKPEAWIDAPLCAASMHSDAEVDVRTTAQAPQPCMQLEELQAESNSEEACSVEHPGAVCCTTTNIQRDANAMLVRMQVSTTVRLANPHSPTTTSHITLSDLEQLGCMSAVQHLHQQATQLATRNGSSTVQSRHEAVLRVLSEGHVLSAEKEQNQFGHVCFRVVLEHPETHEKMRAFVKPCVEDNGGGWHRAEVEAVAYRLNRLLGMDYVPPCAFRKQMDVDWTHYEHGGVFMYWAEQGRELRCAPMEQWGVPSEVVLSDARVLDVLLQNSDRHHGHFLQAAHWAQGSGARTAAEEGWRGALLPVFIDHAAGFRSEAFVHMNHQNAFNTGEVSRVSARTFLRLRCLDRLAVDQALGDLLSPSEVDQVMRRREDVLGYLDALVAQRGFDRVVVEEDAPAACTDTHTHHHAHAQQEQHHQQQHQHQEQEQHQHQQ